MDLKSLFHNQGKIHEDSRQGNVHDCKDILILSK